MPESFISIYSPIAYLDDLDSLALETTVLIFIDTARTLSRQY